MLLQVNYGFELYFCLLIYFFSKFFFLISSLMTFGLKPSGLFNVYIFFYNYFIMQKNLILSWN